MQAFHRGTFAFQPRRIEPRKAECAAAQPLCTFMAALSLTVWSPERVRRYAPNPTE